MNDIPKCWLEEFVLACLYLGGSLDKFRYDFQGQALVKINIGNIFYCNGDWKGALKEYEEGYR